MKIVVDGWIQQNSLLISLLSREFDAGDEFESDCLLSQPVRSLGAVFRSQKFARHSRDYRDDGESLSGIFLDFR
jgi:hypothetical protein